MKRTFLVKKNPTIEAQDNWLIMDYRQYRKRDDALKKLKKILGNA